MITITDINDIHGRKSVSINQLTEEEGSRWDIHLLTADLPPGFEHSRSRKTHLLIVQNDIHLAAAHSHALFIPVVLIGVAMQEGKTKYYYRQKFHDVGDASPQLQLDCCVVKDTGSEEERKFRHDLNDLYLMIAFEVVAEGLDVRPGDHPQREEAKSDLENA